MKKFLSLVLALVMTMSLVTVSAGAKDYADADDITYVEAVDVLSTLGVLAGDETGFRPTDTLKRSEAAKIICALTLTPDTAELLTADSAPFADVAASHWAAGYIAEGVQSGIIAGVGDNKFDPDGKLTGYAYLKMLLVALGYDASIEGLTGANYSINVAKLADELELTKGNDDFVGSAAVTREEAALYALNALKATMVDYDDKGTSITINGVVITSGASKASVVTSKAAKYGNLGDVADSDGYYTVEFAEKVFSKLTLAATGAGVFGRPNNTWHYDGKKIGTYDSKSPILTYTSTVKEKDLFADLGADGYASTGAGKFVNLTVYVDGNPVANQQAHKGDKTNLSNTGNGVTVEIYKTNTANEYVMVVINEQIAKITSVTKANANNGTERAVNISNVGSFETEEFAKGDWVLYTIDYSASAAGEIKSMALAEKIEDAVVTAYKDTTSVTADGTTYKFDANYVGANRNAYALTSGNSYNFYLDSNGYVIKDTVYTASNTDYNLVLAVSAVKDDGFGGDKYNNYKLLNAAGEVEVVKAMQVNGAAVAAANTIVTVTDDDDNDGYKKLTTLAAYNSADSSTAGYVNGSAVTSVSKTVANVGGIAVDNDTVFVLTTGSNKYKVVNGLSSMDNYTGIQSSIPYAVVKKGVAQVLFLDVTSAASSSEADDLVYIVSAKYSTSYDADNKCNVYTYTTTDGTLAATTNGYAVGLYKISATENGYAKTLVAADANLSAKYQVVSVAGEVKVSGGVLTVVNTGSWVLADDVDVTMIDADDVVTTECDVEELVDETVAGTLYLVKKSTTNGTVTAIYFDGTIG